MRSRRILGILFFIYSSIALGKTNSCFETPCVAGDKAITSATQDKVPYYMCPTRELSNYTSLIIGLVGSSYEMLGRPPNISDRTGEPEYPESEGQPNETNLLISTLRQEAGVNTFDEALSQCEKGVNKLRVSILNVPVDIDSIWVMEEKSKHTFWVPSSNLTKLADKEKMSKESNN